MADKDMKWKTLSQKYLIEKPWLTARVDKVELPTGAIINDYYVLEYPDWINTIAITKRPDGCCQARTDGRDGIRRRKLAEVDDDFG